MLAWLATLKSLFDALTMFFTWRARAEEINARKLKYDIENELHKESLEFQKEFDALINGDNPELGSQLRERESRRTLYITDISNVIPSGRKGGDDSNQKGSVQGAKG